MTAFLEAHLGLLGLLAMLVTIGIVSVILLALCRKDHVRTGICLRSFGFFLEARGNSGEPKSKKPRALQQ
jgi:hypothetical protein